MIVVTNDHTSDTVDIPVTEGVVIPVRPARYQLTELLYHHAHQMRDDPSYAAAYLAYLQHARLGSLREWSARVQRGFHSGRVRASEITTCARQVWYRLIQAPPEPILEAQPHWYFAALGGDGLHTEVGHILRWLNAVEAVEQEVATADQLVGGRVDFVLHLPFFRARLGDAAVPTVVDIKTVASEDFRKQYHSSKFPKYLAQVTVYGLLTASTLGVILLIDRGTGKVMDWEFPILPSYGEMLLERARAIQRAVDIGVPPPAEALVDGQLSRECRLFCPYQRRCLAQGHGPIVVDGE